MTGQSPVAWELCRGRRSPSPPALPRAAPLWGRLGGVVHLVRAGPSHQADGVCSFVEDHPACEQALVGIFLGRFLGSRGQEEVEKEARRPFRARGAALVGAPRATEAN